MYTIMMSSSPENTLMCDNGHQHEPDTILGLKMITEAPPSEAFANVVTYLYAECNSDDVNMEAPSSKANDPHKRVRKPTHKGEAYKKKVLSVGKNKKLISALKNENDGNPLLQQIEDDHQNIKKENSVDQYNEREPGIAAGYNPAYVNQKKTKQKKMLSQGSHSHSSDKKRYGKLYNKRTMGGSKKGSACRPTYCCIKCPKKFSRLTLLKNHFHTHIESTEKTETSNLEYKQSSWVCEVCNESFKSARALRTHEQRMHDRNSSSPSLSAQHHCQLCSSTFTHVTSFKVHMRAHRGDKPYHCTECGAEFVQSGHLMIHKRIHTGEKPYTCDICAMQFKQISHLKTHVRTHTLDKPYKCSECKAAFAQNSSLKRHKRSHTGEKPYKCEVCDMTFVVKSNLQRHSYTHTGEKPYSCDLCSASFGQVIDLKRHKISHTGIKPYKCDLCEAQFSRNNNLKWHRLTHAEGAPFKCDACGVNFATIGDFRFHKRSHEPPRPFQCPVCPASFQQSCSLNNHQLIHTSEFPSLKKTRQKSSKGCGDACNKAGIKPYECNDCDASFCEKRNLRRHVISRHSSSRQLLAGADNNNGGLTVQQLTPVSLSEVWQATQSADPWPKLKQEAISNDECLTPKCETYTVNYGNHDSIGVDHSGAMFADVVEVNSNSAVAEQHGLSVLAPGLVTLQQQPQQYSQLIVQGLHPDNSTNGGNISVINGGTSVIVNNTSVSGDMSSASTVVASNPSIDSDVGCNLTALGSNGLLSQLIISTGPNEPTRQARPAGNCPNHSSHFLTLVDAAANHWQAWCLCETATLGQFTTANVSLMASPVSHAIPETILSEGVVPISSTTASTPCSQPQQHSLSSLKNQYTTVASSPPAIRNTFSSVISCPSTANNNTIYTTSSSVEDLTGAVSTINSFPSGCIVSSSKESFQQQHPDNGGDGSVNNSNSIMIVPAINGNNITVLQSAAAMTGDQHQHHHVNNCLTIESLQPSMRQPQLMVNADLSHQQSTTITPGMLMPV